MMICFFKKAVFVSFMFFLSPTDFSKVLISENTVVLNDNVTMKFVGTCDGTIEWKHTQTTGFKEYKNKSRLVARYDHVTGDFTDMEFGGRLKRGNESLYLSIDSVDFNDSGWFEVHCNGEFVREGELKVLWPIEISAFVGDNVTLPCYSLTDKLSKESEEYITWTKNGQVVLSVIAGNVTCDPRFVGRVSVTTEGYRRGDLTLNLANVHSSDQGTYLCSFGLNTDRHIGDRKAVTLTVQVKQSEECRLSFPRVLLVILLVVLLHMVLKSGFLKRICPAFPFGK